MLSGITMVGLAVCVGMVAYGEFAAVLGVLGFAVLAWGVVSRDRQRKEEYVEHELQVCRVRGGQNMREFKRRKCM